jgi:nucleoid DNA-binding protein
MPKDFYNYKHKKIYNFYSTDDLAKHVSEVTSLNIKKSKLLINVVLEGITKGILETEGTLLKNFGIFRKAHCKTKTKVMTKDLALKVKNGDLTRSEAMLQNERWIKYEYDRIMFTAHNKLKEKINKDKVIEEIINEEEINIVSNNTKECQ